MSTPNPLDQAPRPHSQRLQERSLQLQAKLAIWSHWQPQPSKAPTRKEESGSQIEHYWQTVRRLRK